MKSLMRSPSHGSSSAVRLQGVRLFQCGISYRRWVSGLMLPIRTRVACSRDSILTERIVLGNQSSKRRKLMWYEVRVVLSETVEADSPKEAQQKFMENFEYADVKYGTWHVEPDAVEPMEDEV